MGEPVRLRETIGPKAICVFDGGAGPRLVRIVRADDVTRNYDGIPQWYTRPYLERGYPMKSVRETSLKLLTCEMEVLAWASK